MKNEFICIDNDLKTKIYMYLHRFEKSNLYVNITNLKNVFICIFNDLENTFMCIYDEI